MISATRRAREMGGHAQRARLSLRSCGTVLVLGTDRFRLGPPVMSSFVGVSFACMCVVGGVLSEGPERCGAAPGGRSCVEGKLLLVLEFC